jgi:hypothetical protein
MAAETTTILFDFQKLEVYKKAQFFYVGCRAITKDKSLEREQYTKQGQEGECLPGNLNLATLILSADGQGGRTCRSLYR